MTISGLLKDYLRRNEPEYKVFLILRLAFFIVCSFAIIYLRFYYNEPHDLKLFVIEITLLVQLLVYVFLGLFRGRFFGENFIKVSVDISLFVDSFLIYLTVVTLGNNYFALFHGSYLLVLFHSFYSPSYIRTWFSDKKISNYLLGGALSSVCLSMLSYFLIFTRSNTHLFNIKTTGYFLAVSFAAVLMVYFKNNFLKERYFQRESRLAKEEIRAAKLLQAKEEAIKQREQELLKLVSEKFNEIIIASDFKTDKDFNDKLCEYTEALGDAMNMEYCAIGKCDGNYLYDIKPWFSHGLTANQAATLEEVKQTKMEESFVGEMLGRKDLKFEWSIENGDLFEFGKGKGITINTATATKYRDTLLRSGRLTHLLTIGLYSADKDRKPLGYLQLINKLDENKNVTEQAFTKNEIYFVEMFARKVEFALSNHEKYQLQVKSSMDSEFISQLMHTSAVDDILSEMLIYLTKEFNAKVGSYWIPTTDGFQGEKNRKIVLRSVYVGRDGVQSQENKMLENKLRNYKNAFTINECFIGDNIASSFVKKIDGKIVPEIICQPAFNHVNRDAWKDFKNEIDSNYLVAIPLIKTRVTNLDDEQILGVICLRMENGDVHQLRPRLMELSSHLSILLENAIYHQRYRVIDQLKNHLKELKFSDYNKFYKDVVRIVGELLNAEACSLFIASDNRKVLKLKQTTAAVFVDNSDKLKPVRTDVDRILDKELYQIGRASDGDINSKSITGEVFSKETSVIVYDVDNNPSTNWHFMEETESKRHKSLIAAPIIDYSGQTIGVIRCINKKVVPESMIHAFFQGDREFIDLIAVIISRFISNVEVNSAKKIFIQQFGHESKHPLQGILNLVFDTKRTLESGDNKGRVLDNLGLITSQALLIDYLLKDLELLDSNKSIKELIALKPRDAGRLVLEVVKTLKEQAHFDRRINIKVFISRMPQLLIDRDRFSQVLFNLLKNAIRYSNTFLGQEFGVGDIEIYYNRIKKSYPNTTNDNWDVIEIKNWGIGVLEEDKERIFELFERGTNAYTTHTSGTGIGLYVSKEIINGHKGFLEVTKLKSPTIFSIIIPALNNSIL